MSRTLTHVEIDGLEDYQDAVCRAYEDRRPPPWPSTPAQLRWLAEHDPERAAHCLPRDSREIERLGLSPFTGRTVPPFGQRFRERLLATLIADGDFRDAVREVVIGGGA
jgi:hypothetical protein